MLVLEVLMLLVIDVGLSHAGLFLAGADAGWVSEASCVLGVHHSVWVVVC